MRIPNFLARAKIVNGNPFSHEKNNSQKNGDRGEYVMKKGGGSESTIIVGPSKSVLVYALHSLEYVLGPVRFRLLCQNYNYYI